MADLFISTEVPFQAVSFKGADVVTFLQGQVTADISSPSDKLFYPCFFCQYQGKVLANGFLFVQARDSAIFICHDSISALLIENLTPYAKLAKVEISLLNFSFYGLLFNQKLSSLPAVTAYTNYDQFKVATISRGLGIAFGDERALRTWLVKNNYLNVCSPEQWQMQIIRNALPIISKTHSAVFTPNMLSEVPSAAVSVTKGCYVGQEVIARTYHLGSPKRRLCTLFTQSYLHALPVGAKLDAVDPVAQKVFLLSSVCYEDTLWLQVVMRPANGINELIYSPSDYPENIISFKASPVTTEYI